MLFAINQITYSQALGRTCLPTDPNYCSAPCAVVCNIINDTDCPLDFMWGYQGPCGDPLVPAGSVGAFSSVGSPSPLPWHGPCMSFCDGPCECPTLFRVIDPTTLNPVAPWGGAIFTCCWSSTYNGIFFCNGISVNATVTVANGCITFHYHY